VSIAMIGQTPSNLPIWLTYFLLTETYTSTWTQSVTLNLVEHPCQTSELTTLIMHSKIPKDSHYNKFHSNFCSIKQIF
jgi:hypothetical protein